MEIESRGKCGEINEMKTHRTKIYVVQRRCHKKIVNSNKRPPLKNENSHINSLIMYLKPLKKTNRTQSRW